MPGLQMPMFRPQPCPVSVRLLSTIPSQSLSLPSQVSGCGVHCMQTGGSSMIPLQSSSRPLQISTPGAPGMSGVQAARPSLTQQAAPLPEHFFTPLRAHCPTPVEQLGTQKPVAQAKPFAHWPLFAQVQRPRLQVPLAHWLFAVHSWYTHSPSSTIWLQVLSMLSQDSVVTDDEVPW